MIIRALPRIFRVASFRFAALYVGLFAGSALVLGVAVFFEARAALREQMTGRIETEVGFLREEYAAHGLPGLVDLVRERGHGRRALDYLVQDRAGAHLVGEMPATAGLAPGWTTIFNPRASEDENRPEQVRALVTDLGQGITLAVGGDLREIDDLEEAIASGFLWTIGLAATLGIGGGLWLSRAFLRRVDAISSTAEAIIAGDLTQRVPVNATGDDLDRLSGTLNRMLDRIVTLMESLRHVGNDIAHDLRTPLTRLFQRLDEARRHALSVADYQTAVDAALDEADGLLQTFAALLRISQVESSFPRSTFRTVDLSALIEDVADAYRPDAEDSGHDLAAAAVPDVCIAGDKELLTQALANLVENALRHTPAGTHIRVALANDALAGPALSVEDDGPGVLSDDVPHLAERFYRGQRSRTTPGNGLGLSLVKAVAELHGATLDIRAKTPGLCVKLAFPVGSLRPRSAPVSPLDHEARPPPSK